MVLPDGAASNLHTGEAPVLELGDELHRHVLGEAVGHVDGLRLGEGAQGELVEHPQHHPRLAVGEEGGDIEILPHEGEEVVRGEGPGVQAHVRLQGAAHEGIGGVLGELGVGPAPVHEVVPEPGALGAGRRAEGVGKGGLLAEGQAVVPGDAIGLTELREAQYRPGDVLLGGGAAVGGGDQGGVEGDGVDLPVRGEDLPVAVGEDAPGGLHGLGGGALGVGLGEVDAAVDNLGVVEDQDKE